MRKKGVIFLDIDGTLAGRDHVHPRNKEAVSKARKMGYYIILNTGRARSYTSSALWDNIEIDGIISGVGSRIEIHGKAIYEKYIDPEFVYDSVKRFHNTSNGFLIGGVKKSFVLNPTSVYEGWNFVRINEPESFLLDENNSDIQKIEMFGESISKDDKDYFAKHLAMVDYGPLIECGRRDCTKASAMDVALDYLGIKKENSVAIGDSSNDIEMLKNAGIAVAMGNAEEAVKNIADYVSIDCDDGGVGYAIEKMLMR